MATSASSGLTSDTTPNSAFPLMPPVSAPLPSASNLSATSSSAPVPVPAPAPSPTTAAAPRQTLIQSAVHFLLDPKVQNAPWTKRISFLESKGLTAEEIQLAIEKSSTASLPSSSSSSSSSSTSSLPSANSSSVLSTTHPPPPLPPPLPPLANYLPLPSAPSHPPFRNTVLHLVATAGVCYSIASLAKKYLFPLLPNTMTRYFSSHEQQTKDEEHQRTKREEALLEHLERLIQLQETANQQLSLLATTTSETTHQLLRDIQFDLKSLKGAIPIQLGPPKLPSWQTASSLLSTSDATLNRPEGEDENVLTTEA